MVQALINAFIGGLPAGGNRGSGGTAPGNTELETPLQYFIDNHNPAPPGIIPKAYLNWILLDEACPGSAASREAVQAGGGQLRFGADTGDHGHDGETDHAD